MSMGSKISVNLGSHLSDVALSDELATSVFKGVLAGLRELGQGIPSMIEVVLIAPGTSSRVAECDVVYVHNIGLMSGSLKNRSVFRIDKQLDQSFDDVSTETQHALVACVLGALQVAAQAFTQEATRLIDLASKRAA